MASIVADPLEEEAFAEHREPAGCRARHACSLSLCGRDVARILGVFVFGLVLLNLATRLALVAVDGAAGGGVTEIAYRFDLDRENTIAVWYSSLTLFASAVLLAIIARDKFATRDRFAVHWACLAVGFGLMSLDESAAIHEISMVPLRRMLDLHGLFYFAWVVPGACLVLGLAIAYLRFVLHLDRTTRRRFITAALLFLGGALGLETVGGALAESQGFQSLAYILVSTLEETCEMLGILVFLYALIEYLGRTLGHLRLEFNTDAQIAH